MGATSKDHLDDEMIGAGRQIYPDAEVQFPVRAKIEIKSWKDLLLLFGDRIESGDRAGGAVIFKSGGNLLDELIVNLTAGENSKPSDTLGPALSDLDRFVELVICRIGAVIGGFTALRGEVTV